MTAHAEAHALARRLQRADDATAAECRRALLLYWYGSGASHLHGEDDVLLAAWDRHGGADHPLNAAIRADYARLARRVAEVAADPHPAAEPLRRVGRELAAHIRRQERELAIAVSRVLPPEERERVDRSLARLAGRSGR